MKILKVVASLLFCAVLLISSVDRAQAKPPLRGLPDFSPCLGSARNFTLAFAPNQASTFKVGDAMNLHLILSNEGPDAYIRISSMIAALEIRATSKEGKYLARDPHESSMWGRGTGGAAYFP